MRSIPVFVCCIAVLCASLAYSAPQLDHGPIIRNAQVIMERFASDPNGIHDPWMIVRIVPGPLSGGLIFGSLAYDADRKQIIRRPSDNTRPDTIMFIGEWHLLQALDDVQEFPRSGAYTWHEPASLIQRKASLPENKIFPMRIEGILLCRMNLEKKGKEQFSDTTLLVEEWVPDVVEAYKHYRKQPEVWTSVMDNNTTASMRIMLTNDNPIIALGAMQRLLGAHHATLDDAMLLLREREAFTLSACVDLLRVHHQELNSDLLTVLLQSRVRSAESAEQLAAFGLGVAYFGGDSSDRSRQDFNLAVLQSVWIRRDELRIRPEDHDILDQVLAPVRIEQRRQTEENGTLE